MRRLAILTTAFFCTMAAHSAGAPEEAKALPRSSAPEGQVLVRLHLYRVLGALSGDTTLKPDFWAGTPEARAELEKSLTLFTSADLGVGDGRLRATGDGWSWNGEPLGSNGNLKVALPEEQFRKIASPIILTTPEIRIATQAASLRIHSEQPFEYFEKRDDGLFERKVLQIETGIEIEMQIENQDDEEDDKPIHFSKFSLSLSSVNRREPIDDVELEVGRPIIDTTTYEMPIRVEAGKDYGFLLHPRGTKGVLIVRLRAELPDYSEETATRRGASGPARD